MKTYLFYDIETTGLNKAFDQVLQFAAIRTDDQLNELNRLELNIKLNQDVTPSPQALLTHQISPADMKKGCSEYEAMQQIHQCLNEPQTISLGYNSLNFDDEFLRFSFYRNLLPPYTHQFANQCARADLYPMTIMYFLFKPDCLTWPMIDNKISLKLEELNKANSFTQGRAHNALVDVEATLGLARRFFQEKEKWDYLQTYFNKAQDQERLFNLVKTDKQALLIEGIFGAAQSYQSPVYFLGTHQQYKNQTVWLSLDSPHFQKMTLSDFIPYAWAQNKKYGEPGFILPMKERFLQKLSAERLQRATENKAWLEAQPDLLKAITDYYTHFTFPVLKTTDADAYLYLNGFWSREEEEACRQFHQRSPEKKAALIETLSNPLLAELALRIVGRHYPEALSDTQKKRFEAYLKKINSTDSSDIPHDYKGEKRLTPQAALQEIAALKQQVTQEPGLTLLTELETDLLRS